MQGILLVDKPKTWTSFDVVNYVRKIVAQVEGKKPKNCKVGHTGTLDPAATGLLVLLVGKEYTRKATELSKVAKTYEVTMKLGEISTTGDQEGEITRYISEDPPMRKGRTLTQVVSLEANGDEVTPVKQPSQTELMQVLEQFLGEIMQTPPAFSAIKIDGKRAYDLARKGQEVKLEPRKVTIHEIQLTKYDFPYVEFTANVSSGTYIRSLVEDIGTVLGTGAYMSDLRRTTVGIYDIDIALEVDGLNPDSIQANLKP